MIKCIFFDLGGVVLPTPIEGVLTEIARELNIPVAFLNQVRNENKEALWDGKMSVKDIVVLVKKEFSLPSSVEDILGIWEKTYLRVNLPDPKVILLIKNLKKKYKVGFISNLWDLSAQINRKRKLCADFDLCVFSCELGIHKPQKEIFDLAIKKAGCLGEECVFIDDRKEYFKVAEEAGMKTFEYKGLDQLVLELKELGVEVK
ncbi:MAG: HAD-IA family hydrolase [archaeon]|jgi:putative hydrolase of the HAD superfamily